MKKMFLFLALLALLLPLAASAQVPWMKGKTPVPFQKDTTKVVHKPDTVPPAPSVPITDLAFDLDTTLLSPSYYINSSASAQMCSFIFTVLAAGFTTSSFFVQDLTEPLLVGAGLCGLIAIINHLSSVSDLRKASKSLSRVHFSAGGVSIDL